MEGIRVRSGRQGDLPAIVAIYNRYVEGSPVTFDLEPVTVAGRRAWLDGFSESGPYRLLVAEGAGGVVGYACSQRFRPKPAYATSVETTIYLEGGVQGRGLGRRLYGSLLEILEGEDLRRAFAAITVPNPASIALHERLGFRLAGTLSQAGRKFGRFWDVALYERALG